MAVEARRGCGYRKIGGLYLVSSGLGAKDPDHQGRNGDDGDDDDK